MTEQNGCAKVLGEWVICMAHLLDRVVPGFQSTGARDYSILILGRCQDTKYGIAPSWGYHNI